MRHAIIVAGLLTGALSAQTTDIGSIKPPKDGGPNNTVDLVVVLEQTGGAGAFTFIARGTAKLPDGSSVEGFLKHKVNDSPLSSTQAQVAGGAFEMRFGPYPGVYPGLYEVEVVFYPERESAEVQQALANAVGDDTWKAPSSARATIPIGGAPDPVKQAAEAEAEAFESIAKLVKRFREIDAIVTKAHQGEGIQDLAWVEPCRQDLARVDEAARKDSDLYGNPFASELNHRLLAVRAIAQWMDAEIGFLARGTLPSGVEGATENERQENAIGVLLSLREQAAGSLATARSSARVVDCISADVLADVQAARDAREAMKKALALEKKGPSNATRYKNAVTTYRQELTTIAGRNASALAVYGLRYGLTRAEEEFKKAREDLAKALEGALASADAWQKAAKGWTLSEDAKQAESEVDRALSSIASRLK